MKSLRTLWRTVYRAGTGKIIKIEVDAPDVARATRLTRKKIASMFAHKTCKHLSGPELIS